MNADDYKSILTEALQDLQGIKNEALQALVGEYGPRIANVTSKEEYDDLTTNLHLVGDVLGVEAESVPAIAAGKAIQVAAGVALKLAIAA